MPADWSRHAAALLFVVLLIYGCADDRPAADLVGRVEIIVDLDDIERWEARGPLVEAGEFCPSGRRRLLAAFNPDTGEEHSLGAYFDMFDDLVSAVNRPDAVVLNEHACDDGSGAFIAAENQQRGDWEVRSGTGRYSDLTGAGSASFVVDFQARGAEVFVIAELGAEAVPCAC